MKGRMRFGGIGRAAMPTATPMPVSTKTSRRLSVLTLRRLGHSFGAPRALGALAALAAASLLALSGCGGSDNGVASKPGQEILAAAKQAAESASSVHVVSNTFQGPLKASVDLALAKNGGRGHVSLIGLDFEIIHIGSTVYVKGGAAFDARLATVLGKAVHIPQGTWLKGPATAGPLSQLAAFTDLRGELDRLLSTPGPITKGAGATVAGQKAIELKERTKVYAGSLFIATTGKPYPIEQLKSGGRERGRTSFSAWGQPVSLTAPSPAVDVGSLKG